MTLLKGFESTRSLLGSPQRVPSGSCKELMAVAAVVTVNPTTFFGSRCLKFLGLLQRVFERWSRGFRGYLQQSSEAGLHD